MPDDDFAYTDPGQPFAFQPYQGKRPGTDGDKLGDASYRPAQGDVTPLNRSSRLDSTSGRGEQLTGLRDLSIQGRGAGSRPGDMQIVPARKVWRT